jgi:hypothetical protein
MNSLEPFLFEETGVQDISDAASDQASLFLGGGRDSIISKERIQTSLIEGTESSVSSEEMGATYSTMSPLTWRRDSVPIVWLPRDSARRSVSKTSERWEGVVLEVGQDAFRARLVDLDRKARDEEAEIFLTEVSEEDRPLLELGAVFYWSIGYHTDRSGQITRSSLIRFRRLPTWTKSELEAARREAESTSSTLGWGCDASDAAATG